jgi:hypothetical protein
MKTRICLLILFCLSYSIAKPPVVRYFISAQGGYNFSGIGDLKGEGFLLRDPADLELREQEAVFIPEVDNSIAGGFMIGAQVDASTVIFNVLLSAPKAQWQSPDSLSVNGSGRYSGDISKLSVSAEYRYSLLHPNIIRPWLGTGIQFSRLEIGDIVYHRMNRTAVQQDAIFSGYGLLLSGGTGLFFHKNFGISVDLSYTPVWYFNVAAGDAGLMKLKKSIFQQEGRVSVGLWYFFI